MKRSVTPRFVTFVGAATLSVFAALMTGRVEMVAVAAPILVALLAGVAGSRTPELTIACHLETDRCLEGDELSVEIGVWADMDVPELRMVLALGSGFVTKDGPPEATLRLVAGEVRTLSMKVKAQRWGVHPLGAVVVRAGGPGRFLAWEGTFDRSIPVKVFPYLERVRRGLKPPRTHAFAGNYASRSSGDGIEFAQVRQFEFGDRVRSVNWRVTSRRGSLHVNVFHPERNADVIVFVDTFGNFGDDEEGSLQVAVRGAAGIVRHHLQHKDRVGLVAFGGEVRWLTASMGRTQIYRIVDALLESRVLFSYAWKDIAQIPRNTLPPQSLVIAFSPLIDSRATEALQDLAWRGFPLVIVDTLSVDAIPVAPDAEGVLAHRVWRLQRSATRAEFAALGIPVVAWSERDGLDAAAGHDPSASESEGLMVLKGWAVALAAGLSVHMIILASEIESVIGLGVLGVVLVVVSLMVPNAFVIGAVSTVYVLCYLLALVTGGTGIDLAAPAVGVGLYLLLGALHTVLDRATPESAVKRERLVFDLAVITGGGATGLLIVWVGGNARVTGPIALLGASIVGLALLAFIVRLTSNALDRGPLRER